MFIINETKEYLNDKEFLDQLQSQQVKEHFLKIELLDFQENVIKEIQGKATSGSLTIDGNSSVRRTCSFNLIVDEDNFDITNVDNEISINKKFRLFTGYTNTLQEYQSYGETIWFPLGVFVVGACSINNSLGGCNISVSAKDKMCLLNGDVAGSLPAPVSLHESYTRMEDGSTLIKLVPLYDIIREAVIHLGGEDAAKVIVNDVPLTGKKVLRYMGKESIYFDKYGNEISKDEVTPESREVKPGELAGYDIVDFTYPGELIKQAGESITSILDSIKNVLGNYEYFYDVEGNFIFQEIKNYLNTSYTPITKLTGSDYSINLGESRIAHSFKESDIIVSYSNSPNLQNIKNDFIVWGNRKTESGAEVAIRYHVAIDDIPSVPSEYGNIPWQVYLYKYGLESLGKATDPGYYYRELANEIPKLYDLEANKWKDIDPSGMDFFLDFIDTKSEMGKYSIKTIGRRTKAVVDKDVTMLYRPPTPDYVILEAGNAENTDKIKYLNSIGQKFIIVKQRKAYQYAAVGKDAFSVIRDLIFQHTTYNESINVTAIPMYHIQPNVRIEVEDIRSNIYGDYIIKSLSLPLTYEGTMSVTAVRATDRI